MFKFKARRAELEKKVDDLKCENHRLLERLTIREGQLQELRERIDKMEKGERCKSRHCSSCKNACEVKITEYHELGGRYGMDHTIRFNTDVVCAFDAPCPDFKKKED